MRTQTPPVGLVEARSNVTWKAQPSLSNVGVQGEPQVGATQRVLQRFPSLTATSGTSRTFGARNSLP